MHSFSFYHQGAGIRGQPLIIWGGEGADFREHNFFSRDPLNPIFILFFAKIDRRIFFFNNMVLRNTVALKGHFEEKKKAILLFSPENFVFGKQAFRKKILGLN